MRSRAELRFKKSEAERDRLLLDLERQKQFASSKASQLGHLACQRFNDACGRFSEEVVRVRRQDVGARARARKAACPGGTHVHLVEAQREVWSKGRDAPGDTASKRPALKSSGDLCPIATSARFRVVRWRHNFQAKEARDTALALVLVQVLPTPH
jgi:hypothetical protein